MRRSTKIGFALIGLHLAAWAFVAVARPEYDGRDLGALVFWIVLSHLLLIVGGSLLLINFLQWFVNRQNDGA